MMRSGGGDAFEHRVDFQHVSAFEQILRRRRPWRSRAASFAVVINVEFRRLRGRGQFLQFVLRIEMMIRERPRQHHRAAGLGHRVEEFVRMADAGKGQEAAVPANRSASRGRADASKIGLPARAACRTTASAALPSPILHDAGRQAHLVDQPARASGRRG